MGDETFESQSEAAPARRWRGLVTWSGLLTVGLIVYELTSQPAIGVVVLCLKFGWEDFRTARWLGRFDPWRARGRACWWIYVAWGLWKATVVAGVANTALGIGIAAFDPGIGGGPPDRLLAALTGACLTTVAGLGLSTLAAIWGVQLAVRHRVKLWLNGSIRSARLDGYWPPYDPARPSSNRLSALQLTTFFCVFLTSLVISVLLLSSLQISVELGCVLAFLIVVLPPSWLWSGACRFVTANSPDECWLPDELAASADDPVQ